ncbi:hypothetical protein NC651_024761 [Populus alba x Populus x berolinensis]|nr:hypothetical protein NC651_024761 [Populus alba x Populus x berolinensis]
MCTQQALLTPDFFCLTPKSSIPASGRTIFFKAEANVFRKVGLKRRIVALLLDLQLYLEIIFLQAQTDIGRIFQWKWISNT